MQALGQWFTTGLGLSPWLVGLLILPILAVLLVFALRDLILHLAFRLGRITSSRPAWKRVSLYPSVLAGLVVIGLIWKAYWPEIAASLSGLGLLSEDVLYGILAVVLYATILGVLLHGVKRAYDVLLARVESSLEAREGVRVQSKVFLSGAALLNSFRLAMRILRFAVVLFLLYVFVPLLLQGIPATRSIAHQVMPLVFRPLRNLGMAIVNYMPRAIILFLVFVISRWTLRGLRIFMRAVGTGQITVGSFDPSWATQTYQIIKTLVILATILVMYPYLPGADSDVFKGFSVFVGVLITFGATSTTNNIFSGLTLTFSRSFHVGDRVRIGEHVGDVLELGATLTRLRTLDNERVTIPNTVVLKGNIINYTEAEGLGGLKLRVPIGIGYDAEWRDVHRVLVEAAQATANVRTDPAPHVLQSSLDDFAVTYTLVATAEDPSQRLDTLSALRRNIQDRFNEAGIEIMTPSVRAVRDAPDPAIPERYIIASGPALLPEDGP